MEKGMSYLKVYLHLVEMLRESRRSKTWKAEHDRPLLAHLEDLYEKLSDDEQDHVEAEGWRAWPDQYDGRMRALADLTTQQVLDTVARLEGPGKGGDRGG
jgi:hypothetical protein